MCDGDLRDDSILACENGASQLRLHLAANRDGEIRLRRDECHNGRDAQHDCQQGLGEMPPPYRLADVA